MSYTPIGQLAAIHRDLHNTFLSRLTYPIEWRQNQLLQVARMIKENHEKFTNALFEDLGRPALEAYQAEVVPLIERSLMAFNQLNTWAETEDKSKEVPEVYKDWNVRVFRQPKGVVLVISPWNYPMILSIQPLLGAIASGCCCVVKPSEVVPTYSAVLQELLPKYLDQRAFRVVCGAVEETTKLLELKWDHIFYTGNGTIARIISAAAAKHLTPLTLELGGKSPVILDPEYPDLELAARRILWGKTSNAGQICVAPDYVLLPTQALLEPFLKALVKVHDEFYASESSGSVLDSKSFSKIVSATHFSRVSTLIAATKGRVVIGGQYDKETRKMAPTIVAFEEGSNWEQDSLMIAENFGPVLPVVVLPTSSSNEHDVGVFENTVEYIRSRDHPLVLYAFTERKDVQEYIRLRTMSGNLVFNDTFMQLAMNEIPFGGVGESGYGRQVLRYTYEEFTYQRSSIDVPRSSENFLAARYPPYTEEKLAIFKSGLNAEIPEDVAVPITDSGSGGSKGLKDKIGHVKQSVRNGIVANPAVSIDVRG